MYLENPVKTSALMEQEVNEATAALKGMLGIGMGSPAAADKPAETPEEPDVEPKASTKKKKNNKKKKKAATTPAAEDLQSPPPKPPQPDNKKGNNNRKKGGTSNKKKGKPAAPDENFAWSKFQSSPDASKLPMPTFPLVSPTPLPRKVEKDEPKATPPETVALPKEAQSPAEKREAPVEVAPSNTAPASATGVNLAALASSPPKSATMAPPGPSLAAGLLPPQQQQPPFAPPPYYGNPPMQPYGAPPGYVTIRVQVPQGLNGQQMVVNTPSGYPVQVMVPPGIPPGAVIPVHVPAGPPMHMMPPPHPSYGGGYYPPPGNNGHPGPAAPPR
jgi:hypothetical protein